MSEKVENKKWEEAQDYCNSLNTNSYGQLSGWHMPNIDELKTLLTAERVKNNCQVSEATDCLSYNDCWSCLTCSEQGMLPTSGIDGTECNWEGIVNYDDGRFSKLGDTGRFWSSSISGVYEYEIMSAWWIGFSSGYLYSSYSSMASSNIRCVTNNSTPLAQCSFAGGNWNEAENTCTRHCSGKPSNTVWNGTTTYPATYSDGSWSTIAPAYNEETEGTCHFKCAQNYFWDGSACLGKPYVASNGLEWQGGEVISVEDWEAAKTHCENLEYAGHDDWRLPNISELRTLIKNCSNTQMPSGSCGITHPDHLSYNDDWNSACNGCTYDGNNPGQYSKLGDNGWFWSSSIRSDSSNVAWYMDFSHGGVYYDGFDGVYGYNYVRCVRGSMN